MKWLRLLLIWLLCTHNAKATFILNGNQPVVIPFQLVNHLIIIPIEVNGVVLSFLLDSGVSETLVFSLDNQDLRFEDYTTISFKGLGSNDSVAGLKADKVHLKINQDFQDSNHTLYIVLNEDFNLSKYIGVPINGIIGYQFFKMNIVGIDYLKKQITIYPKDYKKLEKVKESHESFPLTIIDNKPMIEASFFLNQQTQRGKMLLDIGSNDALWIFPQKIANFQHNQKAIRDLLGRGFSGNIYGRRSRVKQLNLGSFEFKKPTVAIPDSSSVSSLKMPKDRIGSLGSQVISRFHVIMDYSNGMVYFKKNRDYKAPFLMNMSGIEVIQNGTEWSEELVKLSLDLPYQGKEASGNSVYNTENRFSYKLSLLPVYDIAGIIKDSPGEKAGLQEGDRIIAINNEHTKYMSLQHIYNILGSKEGRRLKLVINRGGEELNKFIFLEDPIPYVEE